MDDLRDKGAIVDMHRCTLDICWERSVQVALLVTERVRMMLYALGFLSQFSTLQMESLYWRLSYRYPPEIPKRRDEESQHKSD